MKSFMQKCLVGSTMLSEIDDYIEFWHTNETFLFKKRQKDSIFFIKDVGISFYNCVFDKVFCKFFKDNYK